MLFLFLRLMGTQLACTSLSLGAYGKDSFVNTEWYKEETNTTLTYVDSELHSTINCETSSTGLSPQAASCLEKAFSILFQQEDHLQIRALTHVYRFFFLSSFFPTNLYIIHRNCRYFFYSSLSHVKLGHLTRTLCFCNMLFCGIVMPPHKCNYSV